VVLLLDLSLCYYFQVVDVYCAGAGGSFVSILIREYIGVEDVSAMIPEEFARGDDL